MPPSRAQTARAVLGLSFVVCVVLVSVLAVALFRQDFTSTRPLTVEAGRAGLQMETGGIVKMRGVPIGRVTSVRAGRPGALIGLAIDTRYLHLIPANVRAEVVPPTLFGAKYVNLVPPDRPAPPIAAHAVIAGAQVSVEINTTFQHLLVVLNSAPAQAVNGALTSLATGLSGNGTDIYQLVRQVDSYLEAINPRLPALNSDLGNATSVLDSYARLTPDLVRAAADGGELSDTLIRRRASLDALLVAVTGLADRTATLLKRNEKALTTTLDVLAPTTRVLAEYAPEFPCLLQGLVATNKIALPAGGGGATGGLNLVAGVIPGQAPYRYPQDLPVVAATDAPQCYGLPNVPPDAVLPHIAFDTGRDPYAGYRTGAGTAGTPGGVPGALATTLFGTLAGLVAAAP